MRGRVLGFDAVNGTGMISGDDGNRYSVGRIDLQGGAKSLIPGGTVDFEANGVTAISVYPLPGSVDVGAKNKWIAAVLALVLGGLGVHKFYLGRQKEGVIMLLCFFPGMFLIVPAIVSGVIAFIEGIIYLVKSEQEFHDQYVTGSRGWF